MTSVPQQSQNQSQASNTTSASQSTQSYASTAKKAVSSPPIATSSSTPSPAVAVGGSAPVQQHGKSSSISPVNGRASIPPAVPAVSAPAIAHSNAAVNGGSTDHSRKSSVTISANGPAGYVPNGGPVGGSRGGIRFGALMDSPAASHSIPQISQPASEPIPIPGNNPRVVSPATSPSPIPQPTASGGRPPSGISQQGNMTFGSLGNDGDVSIIPHRFMAHLLICFLGSDTCDKQPPKDLWHLTVKQAVTFVVNHRIRHKVTTIKAQELDVVATNKVVDVVVVDSTNNIQVILVSLHQTRNNSETTKMADVVACLLSKTKVAHSTKTPHTKPLEAQPFRIQSPVLLT